MDMDRIRNLIIGFALISLIAAAGAIALDAFKSDIRGDSLTSASNESVTLTTTTQDITEDVVTMTNTTQDVVEENVSLTANGANPMTGTFAQVPIISVTNIRNSSGESITTDCNVTINTGAISCNETRVTNDTIANYTFAQFLTGNTTQNYLTSLTMLRNSTGVNGSVVKDCNMTLATGTLYCNHSFVDSKLVANYTYNKNASGGTLSQASLFVSVTACRNSAMTAILLGVHCNVSSVDTSVSVDYDNFTDGLAYIDYTHYTETYMINISNNGLMGIDNTTGYFGTAGTIAGVVLLLTIVMGAFYFVTRQAKEG